MSDFAGAGGKKDRWLRDEKFAYISNGIDCAAVVVANQECADGENNSADNAGSKEQLFP